MDGALGIAIGTVVVIGICIQLAVVLRNRLIKVESDEEKDAEKFASELDLQLQQELDDAINSATPLLSSNNGRLVDVEPQQPGFQVTFADGMNDESSWTTFKRESRMKLQQLAKSMHLLAKDDASLEEDSIDTDLATPNDHCEPPMTELHHQHSHFHRRQLPLLDADGALAERNVLVNAKQYSRILKRRYARQLMEDYFRSQPKPKPRNFVGTGSMRRPRGPGGRFLTAEEVWAIQAGQGGNGVVSV